MTGDDILKLAGDLLARSKSPSEALCRAVVGRSYYGAYHLALTLFADLKLPPSSDHKIPAQWLIASGEPSAKNAGRLLEDLYAARRRADYDLDHPKAIQESRDLAFIKLQIEAATDVKSFLARCAVEPARSQIQSGIRAHIERMAKLRGSR